MSSAKKGLRTAGISGVAALTMLGGFVGTASMAHADWAPTGGQIGIRDTVPGPVGEGQCSTQGATILYPGKSNQAMDDVRLLLPNTFKNGDTIDLVLFDRSATNSINGQNNADTAHFMGFSATPTVTVDPNGPFVKATNIGPRSDIPGNTENNPQEATGAKRAGQPPVFTPTLMQSSRSNGTGYDIVRLKVSGVQADLNDNNKWIVTIGGLKADLGPDVSPGEMRIVPFAYNGAPSSTNASNLFGNKAGDLTKSFNPTIKTYTVPAYVSPVQYTAGGSIVADGTTQALGDFTISETNTFSLQAGTYKIKIGGGATIDDGGVVSLVNPAPGESLAGNTSSDKYPDGSVKGTIVDSGTAIQFTLNQTQPMKADQGKLGIKVSGLMAHSTTKGPLTYTLTGGSIDQPGGFLVTAGTSGQIGLTPTVKSVGLTGVKPDDEFGQNGEGGTAVNQKDICAPTVFGTAQSNLVGTRIGGVDRYDTAAKIARNNAAHSHDGQNKIVVLASGENFPDALSSAYLSAQIDAFPDTTGGGSILLTKQASLPPVTGDAMRLLGTKTVIIVGGTNAVSASVEAQLKATPQYRPGGTTKGSGNLQVIRLDGADRYATNERINEYAAALNQVNQPVGRTIPIMGQSSKLTGILVNGDNFPDAVAAGPAAWGVHRTGSAYLQGNLPIVLTKASALSKSASNQITSLGLQHLVAVGGSDVVSNGDLATANAQGATTTRVSGANRYSTAAAVADWEKRGVNAGGLGFEGKGWNVNLPTVAFLANSEHFPDALAGAPLAGGQEAPILLTKANTLAPETAAWLSANAQSTGSIVALGLGFAVSPAVLTAAAEAASSN